MKKKNNNKKVWSLFSPEMASRKKTNVSVRVT